MSASPTAAAGALLIAAAAVMAVLSAACETHKSPGSAAENADSHHGLQANPANPFGSAQGGHFRSWPGLRGAERVAAIGTARGRMRVVAAGPEFVRLFTVAGARVAESRGARGGAQVLAALDADGDGVDDLVVGWGRARVAPDAPMELRVYRQGKLDHFDVVPLPASTRAQLVAVHRDPDRAGFLLVSFTGKYTAELRRVFVSSPGQWRSRREARLRVPLGLAVADIDGDGQGERLIARPYGDVEGQPGGLFVYDRDGVGRGQLPSTLGVRAVAAAPGALVMCDGWHREYGTRARALISQLSPTGAGAWQHRVLAEISGRHGCDRLRLGDIDGDGRLEAVVAGAGPAWAVSLGASGESPPQKLGVGDANDVFVADLDGDRAAEVIIAGPQPGIWSHRKRSR